ncbi:anthrax toxin lethal factor-related metalloendopeptidase [Bacillus kwashiorkori]|uniref:anthrax toxin lethal factor-related metalloendopeptidase n=1 Tax=Bacillus kwashiorkori TaxID=1522318 RepID=UPI0007811AE5|nr:hypothetical protein [Bacillus kwashiorkori]
MKKNIFSLIVLLNLLLCQQTSAQFPYIFLKDIRNSSKLATLTLQSRNLLNEIIILPDNHFDEDAAAEMLKIIDQLPIHLIQKMKAHQITVQFFTGNLTDITQLQHLKGVTPRGYPANSVTWDHVPGIGGSHTVFVKIGASPFGSGHHSVNLELHELAHSIDKIIFKYISSSGHFQHIWQEEVHKLFGNNLYFILYPEEYFAETFAMYYANEETKKNLIEIAPKTYQFIEQLMEVKV